MSASTEQPHSYLVRSVALRTALFLVFWLLISGWAPGDLPIGLFAVAAATWTSLRLLPAGKSRLRTKEFAALVQAFAHQSIVSGLDVARHALRPQLQLRPGFVSYRCHLPPGPRRSSFCALSSLLPGTLLTGADANDTLIVHCLDVDQPIAANLAAEEALFTGVLADD